MLMIRSDILSVLRQNVGNSVSGEKLGRQFNVSRAAIGKQIQRLRREGYDIESTTNQGHRLRCLPDLLRPEEVEPGLTTQILGRKIHYFSELATTNDEAKKLALTGCPEGTLIIAEEQTGGRGRLARGWFSPATKGIWFSVVLRPPFPPQEAPKCTLMAAVAVNRAIRQTTGISCGIKWPNDILCNGRKLVGILTEMSAEMDAINYVVIGMGINVNVATEEFPAELRTIATSLLREGGRQVSRLELFLAILKQLDSIYQEVQAGGFAPVLAAWRQESITLEQPVQVVGPDKSFAGVAIDIDADGALLVETERGIEKVIAGDVSIRAAGVY